MCISRFRIKKLLSVMDRSQEQTLTAGRAKLRHDITKWWEFQHKHYAQLHDLIPPVEMSSPEDDPLLLPLALPRESRTRLQLSNLAAIEYALREGQAHNALNQIRDAVKLYNCNVAYK
jgi:hypothetical protein